MLMLTESQRNMSMELHILLCRPCYVKNAQPRTSNVYTDKTYSLRARVDVSKQQPAATFQLIDLSH